MTGLAGRLSCKIEMVVVINFAMVCVLTEGQITLQLKCLSQVNLYSPERVHLLVVAYTRRGQLEGVHLDLAFLVDGEELLVPVELPARRRAGSRGGVVLVDAGGAQVRAGRHLYSERINTELKLKE